MGWRLSEWRSSECSLCKLTSMLREPVVAEICTLERVEARKQRWLAGNQPARTERIVRGIELHQLLASQRLGHRLRHRTANTRPLLSAKQLATCCNEGESRVMHASADTSASQPAVARTSMTRSASASIRPEMMSSMSAISSSGNLLSTSASTTTDSSLKLFVESLTSLMP